MVCISKTELVTSCKIDGCWPHGPLFTEEKHMRVFKSNSQSECISIHLDHSCIKEGGQHTLQLRCNQTDEWQRERKRGIEKGKVWEISIPQSCLTTATAKDTSRTPAP